MLFSNTRRHDSVVCVCGIVENACLRQKNQAITLALSHYHLRQAASQSLEMQACSGPHPLRVAPAVGEVSITKASCYKKCKSQLSASRHHPARMHTLLPCRPENQGLESVRLLRTAHCLPVAERDIGDS